MNKVIVRTVSGVVYIALIVAAIMSGPLWFAALMCLFAVLGVNEFETVLGGARPAGAAAWVARMADVLAAVSLISLGVATSLPGIMLYVLVYVLVFYLPVRFTVALYDRSSTAFRSVAYSVLAIAYIGMPLFMLTMVFCARQVNAVLVLAAFIMIWLNDTGAFCVGSLWGRRRLFERLSPKKSWEGFVGGLVFCLLAGVSFYYIIPEVAYSMPEWIGLGAMVCVLSTWGDLFESLFKRSCHVKDSGHLIPGHGGILDRIDSLLFVSIGLFIFNTLLD